MFGCKCSPWTQSGALGWQTGFDYQLWIDSDIVFNSQKFWQLCDLAVPAEGEEKDITAGWYCTEDGQTSSVAHWLDEEDFRGNGGVMNHETLETMANRQKPFTVDYTGFGWVMIKNGVFENDKNGLSMVCAQNAGIRKW